MQRKRTGARHKNHLVIGRLFLSAEKYLIPMDGAAISCRDDLI